ncbi:MAG: universal stress protein [Candidatus Promineifilaceae bacterium]
MGCIVCATRGGASSRAVQRKAIDYARERNQKLVFLYVVDASGLEGVEDILLPAVKSELYWLGRTLLKVAQKRAENMAVTAELEVREGNVQEQIIHFLEERSASLLLLGAPRNSTASVFGDDAIERFAESIHQASWVPVELVHAEDE